MKTQLEFVEAFQWKMQHVMNCRPGQISTKQLLDRHHLMTEELQEYLQAGDSGDLGETLDALVDMQYLLLGTVIAHGFQEVFEEAFRRVHLANMAKEPGINARRKLLNQDAVKPSGWEPADLEDLVE